MTYLLILDDGPCLGSYTTRRAPRGLRATRAADGKLDVLDLLTDEPRDDETLHLYRRTSDTPGFVCVRGKGGGGYRTFNYRYVGQLDKQTGDLTQVSEEGRAWWAQGRGDALRAWAAGKAGAPADQGRLL